MSLKIIFNLDDSWSREEAEEAASGLVEMTPFLSYEVIENHCGKCVPKCENNPIKCDDDECKNTATVHLCDKHFNKISIY